MIAIVSFFLSLVLLTAFLGFRFFEMRRFSDEGGVHFFKDVRAALDVRTARFYRTLIMEDVSSAWRRSLIAFLHSMTHRTVLLLVELVRAAERVLTQLSYRMRVYRPSAGGKGVSPFLKNITREQKKSDSKNGTTPSIEV